MSTAPNTLFDEEDLHELDQLLQILRNADALKLDAAQGLLCALLVGPKPLEPQQWLPAIVGQEPHVEDPQALQVLCERLVQYLSALESAFDYHVFEPIFAERSDDEGETELEVGGWCQGFSMGVDLLANDWEAQMQRDPSLIELLSPVVALGVDDGVFSEVMDPDVAALSEAEREELIRDLPNRLLDVRDYWSLMQADLVESARARHAGSLH
jgi:uncharacterized protein